jgi:hypothetical protein
VLTLWSSQLALQQLNQLADELRSETIFSVSKTGGHLGSSLGVVELTVALHHVFNAPEDRILWDVGHQASVVFCHFEQKYACLCYTLQNSLQSSVFLWSCNELCQFLFVYRPIHTRSSQAEGPRCIPCGRLLAFQVSQSVQRVNSIHLELVTAPQPFQLA